MILPSVQNISLTKGSVVILWKKAKGREEKEDRERLKGKGKQKHPLTLHPLTLSSRPLPSFCKKFKDYLVELDFCGGNYRTKPNLPVI